MGASMPGPELERTARASGESWTGDSRTSQLSLQSRADSVFPGSGEMARLCRAFDWARTPLGPIERWSHSLRTTAGIVVTSRHPMFLWWGPDLIQIYNDAYRPSLGRGDRHPRALGAPGREFWTDIWDAIGSQIEQVMTTGESTWHEDQLLPIERNGRLEDVWWTYSYSPVCDDDGRINATLVVCQETTARVLAERERGHLLAETARAERRAARVLEQISDEHLTMDADFRILTVNAAAERALGRPKEDLVGRTHWEAFPASIGTEVERQYRKVQAEAVEVHFRYRYVGEGYDRLLEIDGYPTDEQGVALFWRDVSERERLFADSERARGEAELARAEAEAANRTKGEFLAVMSHELRTPLNAIGGYAELIDLGVRGPVTAEQRSDLARIQQSQRHLLGLINQVLNHARLETGTIQYDQMDLPVSEAVAAAEALVVPQVGAHGLTYVLEGCEPGLRVRADREKLQQVLLNLLTNAIKFTDAGGQIRVTCSAAAGMVAIAVCDTGIGIAPEKLSRIFEPFVQVDSRLTRRHDGVGLGLSISRDLARGMGGELVATSSLGTGSTFTLTLPKA